MYKILLADDEGIELDALTFILEKNFPGQCTIETAKTGCDAVELAERFRPDIAIMDIRMPGINGMEAIQAIQATSPGILFIVLTAYDKFEYAKEAIRLSVFEFLTKPGNRLVFADVLRRAMGKVDAERKARNNALKTRERIENMLDILTCGTPKERAEVVTDLQKDNRLALMEARNRQIRGDEDGTK